MARNEEGTFASTHDMSRTSEYSIWGNMLYRCNTESSPLYVNYGARGIKVCDAWFTFENFIKNMGERPTPEHSLERLDVDGDYHPDNCVWADKKTQARNRRNSRFVYISGERLQVDEYCEKYCVSKAAIKNRFRRGWSNERIVNTPVGPARSVKC